MKEKKKTFIQLWRANYKCHLEIFLASTIIWKELLHTLFEPKMPKRPPRFFSFEADIVPLMVSCLRGGWLGVISPFCLGVLRSSNGMSPGGVKPDLYRSITTIESWWGEGEKFNISNSRKQAWPYIMISIGVSYLSTKCVNF